MNKIASIIKVPNSYLDDIPTITNSINDEFSRKYEEVLRITMEAYLGRAVDLELDKGRFTSKEKLDSDEKYLYADGNLIGTIKIEFGWVNDDFVKDKITGRITFTPAPQTASYTPPDSC